MGGERAGGLRKEAGKENSQRDVEAERSRQEELVFPSLRLYVSL
jgi:hypothetical protein